MGNRNLKPNIDNLQINPRTVETTISDPVEEKVIQGFKITLYVLFVLKCLAFISIHLTMIYLVFKIHSIYFQKIVFSMNPFFILSVLALLFKYDINKQYELAFDLTGKNKIGEIIDSHPIENSLHKIGHQQEWVEQILEAITNDFGEAQNAISKFDIYEFIVKRYVLLLFLVVCLTVSSFSIQFLLAEQIYSSNIANLKFSSFIDFIIRSASIISGNSILANDFLFNKLISICELIAGLAIFILAILNFTLLINSYETKLTESKEKTKKSYLEKGKDSYFKRSFNNGVYALRKNEYKYAIHYFSLCTVLYPNKELPYINLGLSYSLNDNKQKAVSTFKKAVKLNQKNYETKVTLGILLYSRKKYEEAKEVFSEIVNKEKIKRETYTKALYHLAFCYDLLGQHDEAIRQYEYALKHNKSDQDLLFNLGRLYYLQSNFELAITYFKKVLKFNKDDFEATLNIAQAHIELKDYESAIPFYLKAIKISDNNYVAWYNLAVCYIQTGKGDLGKEAFEKAEILGNNDKLSHT